MINQIVNAYNAGKRVKIILNTKEEIRLYETMFTPKYLFHALEFDNDNLYLITNRGWGSREKTRVIPAKSIFDVIIT
jgi:hypothetical protein